MKLRRTLLFLVLSAGLLLLQQDTSAYQPSGYRWNATRPSLELNNISFTVGSPWTQAIYDAIDEWYQVKGCNFMFNPPSYGTGSGLVNDGHSTVAFVNNPSPDALGETQTCMDNNGNIIEADVVFYKYRAQEDPYSWVADYPYPNYELFPYDNTSYSLRAVALHEFGHVLGLGETSARVATMMPKYSDGGNGRLHEDDKAGARFIYPDTTQETDLAVSNWKYDATQSTLYDVPVNPVVPVVFGSQIGAGSSVKLEYHLENMSTGTSALNGRQVSFYLSTNTTLDGSDRLLMTISKDFPANSELTETRTLTIPSDTAEGIYYLITSVDDGNYDLSKTNATNNTLASYQSFYVYAAPVINFNPDSPLSVNKFHHLQFTVSASTSANLSIDFANSNLPPGYMFSSDGVSYGTFDMDATAVTTYTVIFKAVNGPVTTTKTMSITVNQNPPPVITLNPNQSAHPNRELWLPVTATDPNGDSWTVDTPTALPPGMTLTGNNFSWTPTWGQVRTSSYMLTFTVTDAYGAPSLPFTVYITVSNATPTFINFPTTKSVNAHHLLSFTLQAFDSDNDPLTYGTVGSLPAGAVLDPSTGVFTWTPSGTQVGGYPVDFTVRDSSNTGDQKRMQITVNPNSAPTLSIPDQSVHPNGTNTLTFTVSGSDAEGDHLTYGPASNLPGGATYNPNTQVFIWTPPITYPLGIVSPAPMFTVSDPWISASTTATINVVNSPPTIASIPSQSIHPGRTLTFTVMATDADGDALTYTPSNLPSGATFNTSTHVFSWTPPQSQPLGIVSPAPMFTVSDPWTSTTRSVPIEVYNTQPTLYLGDQSAYTSSPLTFTVTASDPDGDALSYQASGPVFNMGATFNPSTRVFSWTPQVGQQGVWVNNFFSVSDPWTGSARYITITVSNGGSNHPPVLNYIGHQVAYLGGAELIVVLSAADADWNSVTFSGTGTAFNYGAYLQGAPGQDEYSMARLHWAPQLWHGIPIPPGDYTANITVNDGYGGFDYESFIITVTNPPPGKGDDDKDIEGRE